MERLMLPPEHANGFGLTMACGEYGINHGEPNSSTHKLYIFNNFIIIHTILRWHISIGMKWMVLFFLFPFPSLQPWEDIDLSSFSEEESHYCQWRIKCRSHMEIKAWGVVSCRNKVMQCQNISSIHLTEMSMDQLICNVRVHKYWALLVS